MDAEGNVKQKTEMFCWLLLLVWQELKAVIVGNMARSSPIWREPCRRDNSVYERHRIG